MRLDPNKRRLGYGFATIALAISIAAEVLSNVVFQAG